MKTTGRVTVWTLSLLFQYGSLWLGFQWGVTGAWVIGVIYVWNNLLTQGLLCLAFREARLESYKVSIPAGFQVTDTVLDLAFAACLFWKGHWVVGATLVLANLLQKAALLMVRREALRPQWVLTVPAGQTLSSRFQAASRWIVVKGLLASLAWAWCRGQDPFSGKAAAVLLTCCFLMEILFFSGIHQAEGNKAAVARVLSPSVALLVLSLLFFPAFIGGLFWYGHAFLGGLSLCLAILELAGWRKAWSLSALEAGPA